VYAAAVCLRFSISDSSGCICNDGDYGAETSVRDDSDATLTATPAATTATLLQREQQPQTQDNMPLAPAAQPSAICGYNYSDDDECEPAATANLGVGSDGYGAALLAT
jgi:hypothetical protein